jgi:CheY-like chemotaxis protein
VVLDVGLPDESGLMVLDRLKRDDATRHIPIHVVSAADHSQTALSLGAIGYLVKPVKRDDLAEVLKTLESKLTSTVRRVLIVEDDPVQRDAVGRLLSSGDVETVGVGTAAECLEQLKAQTFDCMVLDLSLPDASGFSLLETLSQDGDHAFPPVIVYTGHDLSADDEQRLRRYSSSIIIKGAKSPERLLDEVSLFLHQVVSELPAEQQKMIQKARNRDAVLEGRRVLIVEDDIRNVYSLTNVLEPRGAVVEIARNGQEAIDALNRSAEDPAAAIDLVLMDVMMPVMDGLTADPPDPARRALVQAADPDADGQGHARRPTALHRRRRQRLHGQAHRRGQAALAGPGLDAEVATPVSEAIEDLEIQLLLEALYQRYHYDFRHYARASIKRRLAQAR